MLVGVGGRISGLRISVCDLVRGVVDFGCGEDS